MYDNNDPSADRSSYDAQRVGDGKPSDEQTAVQTAVRVKQSFQIKARMKPGESQSLGTSYVWILEQDRESAMKRIHDWQAMVGLVVPQDRPEWFNSAVLYAFHPGGTIGSNMNDWGGFKAAETVLPRIRQMGVNALWILPVEDRSIYWPNDYYKLQAGLGSPDDYRSLVKTAHKLGFNVLQDCVPHGGSDTNERAKAHPEWLAYKEDGSTFNYWCFDFNYPTWRQYMADVVKYYMNQYDVDGYRVDAVGGSRTPNWAAKLPYERASFSQSQGGVNMLRSLRAAVKSVKPEKAGLLAEVQGSRYGAVADAVYDFTGCYNAFQAIRTQEPADFVKTLRRWLHESQYGEIKGLLRLRHVESHDSLRSQGWYGPKAMRALYALTCFIDGVPLLYQEQEIGNIAELTRIIGIRNQRPELQGGEANYLSIDVPDGVFACLRSKGESQSVVLINFNFASVEFELNVAPYAPTARLALQNGGKELPIDSNGTVPVKLEPYQYLVLSFGPNCREPLSRKSADEKPADEKPAEPASDDASEPQNRDQEEQTEPPASEEDYQISNSHQLAYINKKTGLIDCIYSNGETRVVEDGDLILPADYVGDPDKVNVSIETKEEAGRTRQVIVRRQYPTGAVVLTYSDNLSGQRGRRLVVDTKFEGVEPRFAALTLGVNRVKAWSELGLNDSDLGDFYFPRPKEGRPGTGSIYWRLQGTDVLYDSLFSPLNSRSGININYSSAPQNGKTRQTPDSGPLNFAFHDYTRIPVRVQILGRTEQAQRLTLCFWLIDEEATRNGYSGDDSPLPVKQAGTCSFSIASDSFTLYQPNIREVAGGYLYENDFYRIRIGRGGAITGLWSKDPRSNGLTKIIDQGQIYTDYGWGEKGLRYSNENEVEAGALFEQFDGGFALRFKGRLRGKGRFEKIPNKIEYATEYLFSDSSPTFGVSASIAATAAEDGRSDPPTGFLSVFLPLPEVDSYVWLKDGLDVSSGNNREENGRGWQSAAAGIVPDGARLAGKGQTLLTINKIRAKNVQNMFLDRQNLFFAFADNKPTDEVRDGSLSAWFTPGSNTEQPFTGLNAPGSSTAKSQEASDAETSGSKTSVLKNGDFEPSITGSVSARFGALLTSGQGGQALDGWSIPTSAHICTENPKSGKSCLEVDNTTGEYLLASRGLNLKTMKPGTVWKVTGFARGSEIKQGDPGWKVGCLRVCAQVDGKTQYFSSPSLTGTFDWQPIEFELSVPENCSSLQIQAGLNGATGKIWFDQIEIVPAVPK